MKKLICSVLLFSCFCAPAFAQKNYLPAIVVTNEGDTLQGYISYKNWDRNPYSFTFKKSKNGEPTILNISNTKAVLIPEKENYYRTSITKDIAPVTLDKLKEEGYNKIVKDVVFIRELTKGDAISLYEYIDDKKHYYLKTEDGVYQELIYKVFYKRGSDGEIERQYEFRNQLKQLTSSQNPVLLNQLDKLYYNVNNLKKAFASIDSSTVVMDKVSASLLPYNKRYEFFAGAGINADNFIIGDKYYNFSKHPSKPQSNYQIKAGVIIHENRKLQKFYGKAGLSYSILNYLNVYEDKNFISEPQKNTLKINLKNISPDVSLNYYLINESYFKLNIGAGFSYHFIVSNKHTYTNQNLATGKIYTTSDDFHIENNWTTVYATAGVNLKFIDIAINQNIIGTINRIPKPLDKPFAANYRSTGVSLYVKF